MPRKILVAVLAIASSLLAGTTAASRTSLPPPAGADQYPNWSKIWSHRTLGSGADENTTEGLREVLSLGAGGVEVDIYYDQTEHQLFVQSEEFNQDKRPSTLTLAALLEKAPPEAFIWLDFWNLKDLDRRNAASATSKLETEILGAGRSQHIFVESQSATYLRKLPGDLRRILWIEIDPADDSAKSQRKHLAQLSRALEDYQRSGASAISMDYRQYDATAAKVFADIPLALFTINDAEDLRQAASDPGVKIILSDKPFLLP